MFDLTQSTLEFLSSRITLNQIFISEKLKPDGTESDTLGVYDREGKRIIILRKQLQSKEDYLGTLIHELTHADSGWPDICRPFESQLTKLIGLFASKVIKTKKP